MPSQKQIEANRANAKRSTGPRTEQGKARSRENAWKHGLTASGLLVAHGESVDDLEALRAQLLEEHAPQSRLTFELVDRLAAIRITHPFSTPECGGKDKVFATSLKRLERVMGIEPSTRSLGIFGFTVIRPFFCDL